MWRSLSDNHITVITTTVGVMQDDGGPDVSGPCVYPTPHLRICSGQMNLSRKGLMGMVAALVT